MMNRVELNEELMTNANGGTTAFDYMRQKRLNELKKLNWFQYQDNFLTVDSFITK